MFWCELQDRDKVNIWIIVIKGNEKEIITFSSSVLAQLDCSYSLNLDCSFTNVLNSVASIWFHIDKILSAIKQVLSAFDIKCSKISEVDRGWEHYMYWSNFNFAFALLFDWGFLLFGLIIISIRSEFLFNGLLFKFWMKVPAFCDGMVVLTTVSVLKYH